MPAITHATISYWTWYLTGDLSYAAGVLLTTLTLRSFCLKN